MGKTIADGALKMSPNYIAANDNNGEKNETKP